MTVVPLALRARVLVCIRGGLAVLAGVAAVLVGAEADTVRLSWAFGAVMVSIVLAGDRRGRQSTDPQPLPGDATAESWAEIARIDVVPSTVGVATLAVVSLAFNPVLAGLMGGILGGMAFMTAVFGVQVAVEERKLGGGLYLERATRRLFIGQAHR